MSVSDLRRMTSAVSTWIITSAFALSACSTIEVPEAGISAVDSLSSQPRTLFVLFDGTRNDAASRTNVVRMKDAIEASKIPALIAYFEGVGSARDAPVLESALGHGMEARINAGYRFLSIHHRPGDRIAIVGFSRGAHQARALAGLVAYAGLLDTSGLNDKQQRQTANAVIEAVKTFNDEQTQAEWLKAPFVPPAAAALEPKLGARLRPASIAFLGVWDTVPGSFFKDYGVCREASDRREGERYKTGSYPPIGRIAHAVALDEKRSKFRPILLCPPMLSSATQVDEVWFAGAHADVGGGYEPADPSLQRVSLEWMTAQLSAALGSSVTVSTITDADRLAIAHWSIGDSPANFGSECEDRQPPARAVIHPSVASRRDATPAPLMVRGARVMARYPLSCAEAGSIK